MQRRLIGLLPIVLLGLCAHPALAEQWRWFPVKGGAVAFDEDSLKIDIATGVTSADTVIFYDPPRPVGPRAYSFVAERLEFECRADRHRWSQSAILDAGGGVIAAREDGDWTKLDADKGSTGLFRRMVCLGQTPPGGKQAKDLATLIAAVTPKPQPAAKVSVAPTPTAEAPQPKVAAKPASKPAPLDLDALLASLAEESTTKPQPAPPKPKPKPSAPAAAKPLPKLRPLTLP